MNNGYEVKVFKLKTLTHELVKIYTKFKVVLQLQLVSNGFKNNIININNTSLFFQFHFHEEIQILLSQYVLPLLVYSYNR